MYILISCYSNLYYAVFQLVDEFLHANDGLKQPNLNWKPINITGLKNLLSASYENMAELLVQLQMSGQSFLLSEDTTLNPIK